MYNYVDLLLFHFNSFCKHFVPTNQENNLKVSEIKVN